MASTKTVLITGGNRGLGKALVECFAAKEGWRVVATARRVESLPSNVEGYALDLSKHDHIVSLAAALVEKKEQFSMIIHNAGFNPKDNKAVPGYFESTFTCNAHFSAANVAESVMINALHPMELTGLLLPSCMTADCIVVAVSSWLGSIGEKVGNCRRHRAMVTKVIDDMYI